MSSDFISFRGNAWNVLHQPWHMPWHMCTNLLPNFESFLLEMLKSHLQLRLWVCWSSAVIDAKPEEKVKGVEICYINLAASGDEAMPKRLVEVDDVVSGVWYGRVLLPPPLVHWLQWHPHAPLAMLQSPSCWGSSCWCWSRVGLPPPPSTESVTCGHWQGPPKNILVHTLLFLLGLIRWPNPVILLVGGRLEDKPLFVTEDDGLLPTIFFCQNPSRFFEGRVRTNQNLLLFCKRQIHPSKSFSQWLDHVDIK